MILNLDDEIIIDTDRISLITMDDKTIVVDGVLMYGGFIEKYIDVIAKAFKWQHQTHMYNKELKREGGK